MVCGDVGIDPFLPVNWLPANFKASINPYQLKHQPLRPSIPIAKRMKDIEFAVVMRQSGSELRTRQTNKTPFLFKLAKELIRLRLDSADIREPCAAFADVDRPKCASPVIQVLKQMEVNCPQSLQGKIIEVRLELFNTCLGQRDFSRVQGIRVSQAKLIDQYVRSRIAILNILACAVLIGHASS